jgi:hypothetical protein
MAVYTKSVRRSLVVCSVDCVNYSTRARRDLRLLLRVCVRGGVSVRDFDVSDLSGVLLRSTFRGRASESGSCLCVRTSLTLVGTGEAFANEYNCCNENHGA